MTDPYEVLGVARDATADQIKKAYRRKSKGAHPDREGGSDEQQQQVNDAYALLSDLDRRARFDKGEPDQSAELQRNRHDARVQLLELFHLVLNNIEDMGMEDPCKIMRKMMRDGRAEVQEERAKQIKARERLTHRRNLVKPKRPEVPDMFNDLIEKLIETADERITALDRVLAVNQIAMDMLNDYESGIAPHPFLYIGTDFVGSSLRSLGIDP